MIDETPLEQRWAKMIDEYGIKLPTASGVNMVNVSRACFTTSVKPFLFELRRHCQHFAEDTQTTCKPLMNAGAYPSFLKAGASPPVKATASLLMWSVISSELALLQHGGSRSVGKTGVKGKRGNVYLSLLVGHDSHFDLRADQLPDGLAGSRSQKVSVSASRLESTCLEKAHKDNKTFAGADPKTNILCCLVS